MERGCKDTVLPDHNGVNPSAARIFNTSENVDGAPHLLDPRRPDENVPHRGIETIHVEVGFEGIHLSAKRIPFDDDVQYPKLGLLRTRRSRSEEDQSRARSQRRHPFGNTCPNWI